MTTPLKPQLRYPGQVKDKATRETLANYKERIENVSTCVNKNLSDNTNQNVLIQQLQALVSSLQEQVENSASIAPTVIDGNPVGSIHMYGAADAPDGYLLCDGTAVSRTIYVDLFGIVGTTYGVGDGSTTFNLPDLQDKYVYGLGAGALGDVVGQDTSSVDLTHQHGSSSLTNSSESSHTHPFSTNSAGPSSTTEVQSGTGVTVASSTHNHSVSAATGAGSSHTHTISGNTDDTIDGNWDDTLISADQTAVDLRPSALTVNFIIKT